MSRATQFLPTSVFALWAGDLALIYASYLAASYALVGDTLPVWLADEDGWLRITIVVVSLVVAMYFLDFYEDVQHQPGVLLVQQVCLVVGIAFLAQALLSYGRGLILFKWIMIWGSVGVIVVIPLWRWLFQTALVASAGAESVLLLGSSPIASSLAAALRERPYLGRKLIGYLAENSGAEQEMADVPRLGLISDLKSVTEKTHPDRIVIGLSARGDTLPVVDLIQLRFFGTPIDEIGAMYQEVFGRISLQELRAVELVFAQKVGPSHVEARIQTIYSFVIALISLIVLSPALLLVAILIKLDSRGPVFFRQVRVGLHEKEFTLYKFRSMRADAEKHTGAVWATLDDPRVTTLGKWLRRLRIDEFPQFVNVLRGEMTLVGPRPERPEFVSNLNEQIPYYRQRHYVKPGITGWAQINYKYGDTMEDTVTKLEYDLYYIKNFQIALDLMIIFRTLKIMVRARGSQ